MPPDFLVTLSSPPRLTRVLAPMLVVSLLNIALNLLFTPHVGWALWPIAVFSFGWALTAPVVTLMVLDLVPERRGMASSLQAFIGSAANGLVAGAIAPLVMHSAIALAITSTAMMCVGLVAWVWVKPRMAHPEDAPT